MNILVTVETTKTDPTPHKLYPKVSCVFWKRKEEEEKSATGCVTSRCLLRKKTYKSYMFTEISQNTLNFNVRQTDIKEDELVVTTA